MQLLAAIIDTSKLPKPGADQAHIDSILSIVFAITGSIAILMIVIGGFRYIIAGGDPSAVGQAKKTILYALIGLVVTISAFAIIRFVIQGIG